nr:uncharacterized protein LOC122271155 [Parasteatoda tepidariorum]
MNKIQSSGILKRLLSSNICKHWLLCRFSSRTFLSEAYFCEETWKKRMDSSTLKDIKLDQYFVDTDKKFGTKRLVSGVDLDIKFYFIANNTLFVKSNTKWLPSSTRIINYCMLIVAFFQDSQR